MYMFTAFGPLGHQLHPTCSLFFFAKVSCTIYETHPISPGKCAMFHTFIEGFTESRGSLPSVPIPASQKKRASHLSKTNNLRPNSKSGQLAKSKPRSLRRFELRRQIFWEDFFPTVFYAPNVAGLDPTNTNI